MNNLEYCIVSEIVVKYSKYCLSTSLFDRKTTCLTCFTENSVTHQHYLISMYTPGDVIELHGHYTLTKTKIHLGDPDFIEKTENAIIQEIKEYEESLRARALDLFLVVVMTLLLAVLVCFSVFWVSL